MFPFLSIVSRFKGSDQKINFSKHVLQLKERLVTSSMPFLFSIILSMAMGAKVKTKLTFSWSLWKILFSKVLFALAVLDYLPKLRRVMGLVFSTGFLLTFSIKIFLIKYPIKWPSFTIWGVWLEGLRYFNVPGSNPIRNSTVIWLPEPTLRHYERNSLTNSLLITLFSSILIERSSGGLKQPNLTMSFRLTSDKNCYNAVINIELLRLTPR